MISQSCLILRIIYLSLKWYLIKLLYLLSTKISYFIYFLIMFFQSVYIKFQFSLVFFKFQFSLVFFLFNILLKNIFLSKMILDYLKIWFFQNSFSISFQNSSFFFFDKQLIWLPLIKFKNFNFWYKKKEKKNFFFIENYGNVSSIKFDLNNYFMNKVNIFKIDFRKIKDRIPKFDFNPILNKVESYIKSITIDPNKYILNFNYYMPNINFYYNFIIILLEWRCNNFFLIFLFIKLNPTINYFIFFINQKFWLFFFMFFNLISGFGWYFYLLSFKISLYFVRVYKILNSLINYIFVGFSKIILYNLSTFIITILKKIHKLYFNFRIFSFLIIKNLTILFNKLKFIIISFLEIFINILQARRFFVFIYTYIKNKINNYKYLSKKEFSKYFTVKWPTK